MAVSVHCQRDLRMAEHFHDYTRRDALNQQQRYKAGTQASVDGWDAADIRGGTYAAAKQLCELLPASDNILALLKGAACRYAMDTPSTPWRPFSIEAVACEGNVSYWVGRGVYKVCEFDDRDRCDRSRANWASSVETSHWAAFGGPSGVASRHVIVGRSGDPPWTYEFCPDPPSR